MPPGSKTRGTKRGPNWDHAEDKMLARAWLVVSRDGIVGTDQTADIFWERVAAHYNEIRPRRHDKYKRAQNAVMKRWQGIRLAAGKFCGCIASVHQLNERRQRR